MTDPGADALTARLRHLLIDLAANQDLPVEKKCTAITAVQKVASNFALREMRDKFGVFAF